MEKEMRLDKYLADMGKGSRSQIKEAARKGRIQINGVITKKPDTKVNAKTDTIVFDGAVVSYVTMEYYMLNKPQGVVSATEDNKYQTVIDLIDGKNRKDLFPVGRLDIDTEGLLLITNDGPLAHRLLAPKKHVDKTYLVETREKVTEDMVLKLEQGVDIGEEKLTLPAKVERKEDKKIELTITEGKFHQVKRMLKAVDNEVVYLKRLSMGSLKLDGTLALGEYRSLTDDEILELKKK